jgi:hypothetical protein
MVSECPLATTPHLISLHLCKSEADLPFVHWRFAHKSQFFTQLWEPWHILYWSLNILCILTCQHSLSALTWCSYLCCTTNVLVDLSMEQESSLYATLRSIHRSTGMYIKSGMLFGVIKIGLFFQIISGIPLEVSILWSQNCSVWLPLSLIYLRHRSRWEPRICPWERLHQANIVPWPVCYHRVYNTCQIGMLECCIGLVWGRY